MITYDVVLQETSSGVVVVIIGVDSLQNTLVYPKNLIIANLKAEVQRFR
jgi:hypothetical protein